MNKNSNNEIVSSITKYVLIFHRTMCGTFLFVVKQFAKDVLIEIKIYQKHTFLKVETLKYLLSFFNDTISLYSTLLMTAIINGSNSN